MNLAFELDSFFFFLLILLFHNCPFHDTNIFSYVSLFSSYFPYQYSYNISIGTAARKMLSNTILCTFVKLFPQTYFTIFFEFRTIKHFYKYIIYTFTSTNNFFFSIDGVKNII